MKYKDLDYAVRQSLKLLENLDELNCPIWYSKADLKLAFRILCTSPRCWWLMIIMAISPVTKKKQYFVDKCLHLGHCISCALFKKFSDALAHLLKFRIRCRAIENTALTNYLDDFLFAALSRMFCNAMMMEFLQLCKVIGVPVSEEKTEWACTRPVFLGILLDGKLHLLAVLAEKQMRAINSLQNMLGQKKATVREIQS